MRVELPFLADGVEGGDVVQVLVHEGDHVTAGQALLELETDKATVPVPAPSAGKVARVLVRQGDHLKVGQALVELEGDGGAPSQKAAAPATQESKQPAATPSREAAPAFVRDRRPRWEPGAARRCSGASARPAARAPTHTGWPSRPPRSVPESPLQPQIP